MRTILIHEAELEFWESVGHYESQQLGLGVRFKEEVDRFIEKIEADPLRLRLREKGYRRVNLSVFRHYIAFVIREDVIWIVAICHAYRKPEFWLDRMKST